MVADTTLIINIRINTQTTDQNLYIKVNYTTIGINTQGTLYLLCNTAVPNIQRYTKLTHMQLQAITLHVMLNSS